jgi:hypothetical protein
VEFVTPAGWEFEFENELRPAGFQGIAQVVRCHLSQTPHPGDLGNGRWITGTMQDQNAIGFDIPAVYYPQARIEGECLVFDTPERRNQRIAVRVPYLFVKRAFPMPENQNDPIRPCSKPTSEEILNIAKAAADRLWAEHSVT